jgi:hypothetical protein
MLEGDLLAQWRLHDTLPMWNEYASNPILSPEAGDTYCSWCSVWKDGTDYHLFFSYDGFNIGHATSTDGLFWTKDTANNPVVSGHLVPLVWKVGSTWYMLYRDANASSGIKMSTSPDAVTWTADASNPVLAEGGGGTWDNTEKMDPWTIMKVGTTYYLWYSTVDGTRRIGLATIAEADLERTNGGDPTNWTKDGNNPIFDGTSPVHPVIHPHVFKSGSTYYMLLLHEKKALGSAVDYYETLLYSDSAPTFYSGSRTLLKRVTNDTLSGWAATNFTIDCILTDDINRDSFPSDELWAYTTGKNVSSVYATGLLRMAPISWAVAADTKTVVDNTGGGDDGTAIKPVSTLNDTDGMLFNGVDDYIDISSGDYDFDISTISFFCKPYNNWGSTSLFIFSVYKDDNNRFYLSDKTGGTEIRFYCKNGGSAFSDYDILISQTTLVNKARTHFAFVSTGSNLTKLYINGTEVTGDGTFDQDLTDTDGGSINLGCYAKDQTGFFHGLIDNVMIFDRALSAVEITYLYNSNAGVEILAPSVGSRTGGGLVG